MGGGCKKRKKMIRKKNRCLVCNTEKQERMSGTVEDKNTEGRDENG